MLKQKGEEGFIHLFDKYLSDSYYMSQALFAGQWEVTLPLPLWGASHSRSAQHSAECTLYAWRCPHSTGLKTACVQSTQGVFH